MYVSDTEAPGQTDGSRTLSDLAQLHPTLARVGPQILDKYGKGLLDIDGVTGVGVAIKQSGLAFVIQFSSYERLHEARKIGGLPEEVEGLRVSLELADAVPAYDTFDETIEQSQSPGLFARLSMYLGLR